MWSSFFEILLKLEASGKDFQFRDLGEDITSNY